MFRRDGLFIIYNLNNTHPIIRRPISKVEQEKYIQKNYASRRADNRGIFLVPLVECPDEAAPNEVGVARHFRVKIFPRCGLLKQYLDFD